LRRAIDPFSLAARRIRYYPRPMTPAYNAPLVRAVLFDFDGTLTEPGAIDFNVIRKAIGCPRGTPVLEFIAGMASPVEKAEANRVLEEYEAEAAGRSEPNAGTEELIEFLRSRGIVLGIISRNSRVSIETSLRNFERVRASDFSVILSRDDPFSPKPDPEGILAAAAAMGVPVAEVLVVGDFVFDIEAGRSAGALTALLRNRNPAQNCACPADFTVSSLTELIDIVRRYSVPE